MEKYISPSGYYELDILESWSYSEEGNIVSFFNEVNGVGAIQISSYSIDKGLNIDIASELAEILNDKFKETSETFSKISVNNNLANYSFAKDNRYWDYYLLFKNGKLLFITYNCEELDKLIEKKVINKIINSIKL